jgi:hypothetical protein
MNKVKLNLWDYKIVIDRFYPVQLIILLDDHDFYSINFYSYLNIKYKI